ncbi:hypothetical protein HAHE_01040 [Haloferula helveola]|uniref:Planctomycete cytochrome C n=1 Tax=Haloferula helveola TaxID=490095 RepID=A0ABM7R6N3_9BACT|nr:hypothetical protein HAHE_01040 [Haloferula helveola]
MNLRSSIVLGSVLLAGAVFAEERVSFQNVIKPLLSDRCFKCHGPDAKNQKSDFRLDTEEHAHEDLGGYFGIVPGNLQKSELHHLIRSEDEDEMMPPPDSNLTLSDAEKDLIDRWILQGAKYEKHWSFVPVPETVQVPSAGGGWALNEIDRFVARGHSDSGMKPAPESPRAKWLRRVSFDLTGLPPTLEEIDAFESDTSEDAYEKVADRLLATDAYAERMTAEWLDVARYSDSYGYQRDHERRVWPWRDWVLRAFRDNMPYGRFITEQVAGDLIPGATDQQRLATTFSRLHGHCMEGGSVLEEYRCEYVADRVETVGTAFLGLTMNCTRCHDHKYDPLTMRDFYSLGSFFANVDESGLIAYFSEAAPTPAMPLATPEDKAALAAGKAAVEAAESELRQIAGAAEADFVAWLSDPERGGESGGLEVALDFESVEKIDGRQGRLVNDANPEHSGTTKLLNRIVENGRSGRAILVTGDDSVEVHDVGAYDRDQPWSAAVWIKPSEIAPRANILSRGKGADDSACMGYEFLLSDGKPTASLAHFWPGDAVRVQTREPVEAGKWVHLGVTYDGSSKASGLRIFVNGSEAETVVVRDGLTRSINQFTRVGNGDKLGLVLGERFRDSGLRNGLVDGFRFWSREASSLEIAEACVVGTLSELLAKAPDELDEGERSRLREHFLLAVHPSSRTARQALQEERAGWNKVMDSIPAISVMREMETPRKAYILERGAYDSHGEEVSPDTPGFLPPMAPDLPKNRLGFAGWLTDPGNPLTSRVTVNRYWQLVFGRGLVATSEDFGVQGTPPTHPELLDWLSRDFMDHGWNVKRLLRMMVLSATYRQSTEATPEMRHKDPENLYLARSHTTRLAAEMIRDNALAVSGLLVDKWGGPTAKPYQVEVSFKPVKPDKGDGLYRRSVYTWWKRNAAAPVLTTFGAPKRDVCTVKREVTTSPLQSLILLNDPQFLEASRVLAADLCKRHGEDGRGLVAEAFRRLTSRPPTEEEGKVLLDLFKLQLESYASDSDAALKLLQVGAAPREENIPLPRLAAATLVVNAIMNLDESLIER